MSAPFGTPASIDPWRVFALPQAMQREAALMLLDMGLTRSEARRRLALDAVGFGRLVDSTPAAFRRGGEEFSSGVEQ